MRHHLLFTLGLLVLCASLAACGASIPATATTAPPTRAAPAAATIAPTAVASSGAAAATRPVASATAPPVVAIPTTPAPAATTTTIAVELKDFAIALNTSTAPAGMVMFTVKNMGPSPHNFNVRVNGEEKGVATLDPGTTATLTLDLPPGTYTYRCDIPGHDLLGMKGTLTVR